MIYDTNLYYKFTNLYNIKLFKSANPDQKWKCLAVALLLIVKLIRKPSTKDAYNAFKIVLKTHCVKSVQIRCFFRPYFFVFSPNTEKYGPEKITFLNTFHAGTFRGQAFKTSNFNSKMTSTAEAIQPSVLPTPKTSSNVKQLFSEGQLYQPKMKYLEK